MPCFFVSYEGSSSERNASALFLSSIILISSSLEAGPCPVPMQAEHV